MDKDLKDIWKLESSKELIEEEAVDKLLQQSSTNMLDRIIKTIRKEHKFNFILYPIILASLLFYELFLAAGLCLVIFISTVYYYNKLLSQLSVNFITLSTYEYLKHSYRILEKFMNHYKISGVILTTAGFAFGLQFSGGWESLSNKFSQATSKETLIAISLITVGLVVSIGIFLKLIDLMYTKKMKSLKTLISDLEESL